MFNLFKREAECGVWFVGRFNSNQKSFLEEADNAYFRSINQLEMSFFAKYCTRALFQKVYHSLRLERSWVGVSGKFKKTTWTFLEEDDKGNFTARKEATFNEVKISKQLAIKAADDYKELWSVVKDTTNKYIVDNIVQL